MAPDWVGKKILVGIEFGPAKNCVWVGLGTGKFRPKPTGSLSRRPLPHDLSRHASKPPPAPPRTTPSPPLRSSRRRGGGSPESSVAPVPVLSFFRQICDRGCSSLSNRSRSEQEHKRLEIFDPDPATGH